MIDYIKSVTRAADEIRAASAGVSPAEIKKLAVELSKAKRIALHGLGREGLMMRALAMRLFHLGLDAHVVGEMTTPPVGRGDLMIVSAGPGHFRTIRELVRQASLAGARTACVTAQPKAIVPMACDTVLTIPAQTMANDTGARAASRLPMGSVFEGAQFLTFEVLILILRERLRISPAAMRRRHTNLE